MKLTCLSLLATVAMVTCQQHTTHPHGPQTTTQAMTTPMVTEGSCRSGWGVWINKDTDQTDDGDDERLTPAELAALCPGGSLTNIECQTVDGIVAASNGDLLSVSCNLNQGLLCLNADNAPMQCSDYQIRFECTCGAGGTTPSLAPPDVTGGASPTAGPTTSAPTTVPMVITTSAPDTTQPPATTAPVVVDTSTPSAQPVTQGPTTPTPNPVTAAAASSTPAPTTTSAPPTTTRPGPQSFYPSIDEIVEAFRRLSESEYFQKLNYENQMLVLELVSGGQAGQIKEILDSHGWERILTFIYDLPFRYLDTLMQFILGGLERERLIQAAAGSV